MTSRAVMPLALFMAAVAGGAAPMSAPGEHLPVEIPGIDLPVLQQHTYRMSGRVRMLLLWVGRDDVGSGVIRWRGAGGDHAYELLIGSDPTKAPGKLNKWGFLAEAIRAGECAVVGVISKDSDSRLSEVKEGLASDRDGRPFDTIRGRVTQRQAYAQVTTLIASNTITYHQADAVLKRALGAGPDGTRQIDRPDGARPGFLTSVAEILRSSSASAARGTVIPAQAITYVYGDRLYELRLIEAVPLAKFERDGRNYEHVIRGRFETGQKGVRPGSRFELVFGTSGALAGVPILISYQPRWWLHVELVIQT
ncbi:MAG: hypothetical protein ND807_01750 [Vicinamibacterales bacterium]|nr:hypothetical protein [Vicinamibacterales bacterium]